MPDVWVAFGDYFFNNSQGQRNELERVLDAYKRAEEFTESRIYGYTLYKQGWCYFNMADYATAKDKFKRVVLYGERADASAKEKNGGKSGQAPLVREARADYVRAYARLDEHSGRLSNVLLDVTRVLQNDWNDDVREPVPAEQGPR